MQGIPVGVLTLLVDFLLLKGTSGCLRIHIRMPRMVVAALAGGLSAAACFLPGFGFLGHVHWRVIFIILTGVIAFWEQKKWLSLLLLFTALHLALDGIAVGIGRGGIWSVLVCGGFVVLLRVMDRQQHSSRYSSVRITHRGRTVALTALMDTGNTLCDPVSGHEVLVVDAEVAKKLLGLSMESLKHPLQTLACGSVPGLRLIPYHSVGNPNGMMLGIRAEELLVNGEPCERIIGFAPQRIGMGNGYEALAGGMG